MGSPKQPVHPEYETFTDDLDRILKRIYTETIKNIFQGDSVDDAINNAATNVNYEEFLRVEITGSAMRLVKHRGFIDDNLAFREAWLNKTWPGDNLKLSAQINNISKMDDIKASIKMSMRDQDTWIQMSNRMTVKKLQSGDIAEDISKLKNRAIKSMSGSPDAIKEYRQALNRAQKRVNALAQNGAPTGQLRRAYQKVIDATKKGKVVAIEKAVERAITEKARYNAQRIARTEMSRSYSYGTYQGLVEDEDVLGIKYRLSARHKIYDICDVHTSVDPYGMGKGVYPAKAQPKYPFHPQCTCVMSYVYDGTVPDPSSKRNEQNVVDWLNSRSKTQKDALFGKKGAQKFNGNNKMWKSQLNNFEGYKSVTDYLKDISKEANI